jgi:hypothetical protein
MALPPDNRSTKDLTSSTYGQIRMHFQGAKARMRRDGGVSLALPGGAVELERPILYNVSIVVSRKGIGNSCQFRLS